MRIKESSERKRVKLMKYVRTIILIVLYLIASFALKDLAAKDTNTINLFHYALEASATRGVITQIQMLISIYLVLKENKTGFIISAILNLQSLLVTLIYLLRSRTMMSLPGIITYLGILLIIILLYSFRRKTTEYITRIENQKQTLEESENKLNRLAFYDSLTELPNKDLFMNRLDQNIYAAKRNATLIGVAFIDLDSFKSINDTMGHSIGDDVLKQIANRLISCLRKEDTVSRFGGDEFLLQIVNIRNIEDLHTISSKVEEALREPITVQNTQLHIAASIGFAIYPIDGETSETLLKNADIAMYQAKHKGKNQCIFCTSKMKNDITKKLRLTNSLYRALERNELFLHYQPQVYAESKDIVGFEALLRWNDREYGMVPPDIFIPLAEKSGMIKQIGLWVIKTACEQCKNCRTYMNREYRIAINLSIEQLKDAGFVNQIKSIFRETGADPNNLQIEITESIAFNKEPYVLERINEIKALGVTIAIDDFGTGHSSFSRLKTFPIDLIKIDMEFVWGITSNSQKDKEIILSIIQLAKNLGIRVLAEGVETEEQYQYLRDAGCDEIQGYYFAKPMLPEDIKRMIANPQASDNPIYDECS